SGVAHATIDMFLKIADIQGETADRQHMHEIDVLAFSWGVGGDSGQPATRPQQPGVAARACVSGFLLTKYIDSAAPDLLQTASQRPGVLRRRRDRCEMRVGGIRAKGSRVTELGNAGCSRRFDWFDQKGKPKRNYYEIRTNRYGHMASRHDLRGYLLPRSRID